MEERRKRNHEKRSELIADLQFTALGVFQFNWSCSCSTGPYSVEPTEPSSLWTEACSLESFHFRNGREWNKKLFNQMWYMCACQVVISIFYDKSRQDKTKHFFNFRATSDVSEHRLGKSRIRISNQSSLPSSKCVVSDFCLFSEFFCQQWIIETQ